MKEYIVEFIDPKTKHVMVFRINAEDKTEARDRFFELYPSVQYITRITLQKLI